MESIGTYGAGCIQGAESLDPQGPGFFLMRYSRNRHYGHATLLEFIRKDQETLVLKPNRAYGGEGVTLGHTITAAEWEATVQKALTDKECWVVQQLASIPVHEFPVVTPEGQVHVEPFYVVMGFAPTKYGLAILGRASQKQLVNVAQRGGMIAVLVGHPPGRLVGPSGSGKWKAASGE